MAGPVRLSDVVIPAVYLSYTALNSPELTAFYQAGLVARTPMMDAFASSAGKSFTLPFWKDLDANVEPNYSNDDPADLGVPEKVGTGTMTARKSFMNKSFSSMDLIGELTGSEPLQHIRNRFGTYWQRQWQRRLIAIVKGLHAANVAQNAGDMTVNIGAEVGAAARFNSDAVIDASGTMGDAAGGFSTISVHGNIRTKMLKDNEIETIQDSNGKLVMELYKTMRVVVDDSMPILSGTGADALYLSVLMGGGAFGFGEVGGSAFALGEGVPMVAAEIDRTPQAGNGGGMEALIERKTQILHPSGFSWTDASAVPLVEFSPTLADLARADHWSRVVDRKNVPFAFLVSKA